MRKFKNILRLIMLGTVFVLVSCQAEEEFVNENLYQKNGIIMHKKFEELIQETQFRTAFEKIYKPLKGSLNKENTSSKTVMNMKMDLLL